MVTSKKMSKTSIAVIVLSLLLVLSMVLSLTGAWFISSDKTSQATPNNLVFGSVGNVKISATAVRLYRGGANGAEVTAASGQDLTGPVLPGDRVTAGGVKFEYDDAATRGQGVAAATEGTVWYLIKDQNGSYYVMKPASANSTGHINVLHKVDDAAAYAGASSQETLNAGESNESTVDVIWGQISADNEVEVQGQDLVIKLRSNPDAEQGVDPTYCWYSLNGNISNTPDSAKTGASYALAKDSWEIPNYAEGVELNSVDGYVGDVVYNNAGTTYAIAVVQLTNVNASTAFAILKAELDGILASPVEP